MPRAAFSHTSDVFIDAGTSLSGGYNWFKDAGKGGTGAYIDLGSTTWSGADPAFVNSGSGDFHLRPSSPLIDAGTPIAGFSSDLEGTFRPQGSAPDIGAYEFSDTGTNTATPTFTSTPTSSPTFTPSSTCTPTRTSTPTRTATFTSTFTLTASATPSLTATSTPTDTSTVTPTATPTETSTNTDTPTFTPSNTPTFTPTFTFTFTPTSTDTSYIQPHWFIFLPVVTW